MNTLPFVVVATYVDECCLGRTVEETLTFPDAKSAGAWIGQEIVRPDVLSIACPALGMTLDGPAMRPAPPEPKTHRVQIRHLTGNLAGLVTTELTKVPREVGRVYTAAVTGDRYEILSSRPLDEPL